MKKFAIIGASLLVGASAFAADIVIKNLPYTEGKLYIAVMDGNKPIDQKAIEVEADSIKIAVDLAEYVGKEVSVNAFQDLNDNQNLDMDQYGRPTEPCVMTTVKVKDCPCAAYDIELKQY